MAIRNFVALGLGLASILVFANFALADESAGKIKEIVICKSSAKDETGKPISSKGKSVRTLRVYETVEKTESGVEQKACRASYTKADIEQTVGSSRQIQQCRSILSGIEKNLEASNWSCRHAGAMPVLKSSAVE